VSDFSTNLRSLLAEARKLKALVIDQSGETRDSEWLELVKLTCEQLERLQASFAQSVAAYNAALRHTPTHAPLDAQGVTACTRAYLTSIKRSMKANLVLFSDQERVQRDLDALNAALKALIATVAANQALDDDEDDDDDDDDGSSCSSSASSSSSSSSSSPSTAHVAAAAPTPVAAATASSSTGQRRSRADTSGLLALDAALSMIDEAYGETDVLLQKSSATSTPSDERRDVILAVRLADSSFQTLLRFSLQATVTEALAQVQRSLVRVGQIAERDPTRYALFRLQAPNERRLEPPDAPLSKFELVNRDVVIYKAHDALAQREPTLVLIGADVGRVMTINDVDQRVHGLPRRLLRPKRQLCCQASFVRPADRKRASLLLLFNDLLVVAKPKSSVARLVDRVRAAVDVRGSHDDSTTPKSPVLAPVVKTTRKGASYHHSAVAAPLADDEYDYVASFELQFLHIREQAACTDGLPHSFAIFGTSRFDNPPTTPARSDASVAATDDAMLEQLPHMALQFANSSERIDFLAELRKVIRVNRARFDGDGDFGEPNGATSPRRSVFARRAAPPAASSARQQPPVEKSPPRAVSPDQQSAAANSSLRRRAVAHSPAPNFAPKPPATEADARALVKPVLVAAKVLRTAVNSGYVEELAQLRSLVAELDDMCARLDAAVAPPYRVVCDAVLEFQRIAESGSDEAAWIAAFHSIVEKARALLSTP